MERGDGREEDESWGVDPEREAELAADNPFGPTASSMETLGWLVLRAGLERNDAVEVFFSKTQAERDAEAAAALERIKRRLRGQSSQDE